MTQITKAFQVRVALAGATQVDTFVDFTLAAQLEDVPEMTSQVVRPVDGHTESPSSTIPVVDAAGVITSRLGNVDGKLQLIGRLADVQLSQNGGAMSTIYTGRLVDLSQRVPGVYDVVISDERWVERRMSMFTKANGLAILPTGVRPDRLNYVQAPNTGITGSGKFGWKVRGVDTTTVPGTELVNLVRYVWGGPYPNHPDPPAAFVPAFIKGDVNQSPVWYQPNFQTLRFQRVTPGTPPVLVANEQVVTFDSTNNGSGPMNQIAQTVVGQLPDDPTKFETYLEQYGFWIDWTGTAPAVGDVVVGALIAQDYVASEEMPLIEGMITPIHPMQFLKNCYDGLYTREGTVLRYDPAAIAALIADPTFGLAYFRITQYISGLDVNQTGFALDSTSAADWLEQNIYKPYQVIPFIDNLGRIAPKRLALAPGTDVTTLPLLTDASFKDPPTWGTRSREIVTAIIFNFDAFYTQYLRNEQSTSADGLGTQQFSVDRTYDGSLLGLTNLQLDLVGHHHKKVGLSESYPGFPLGFGTPFDNSTGVEEMADRISQWFFNRYGDNPQYGSGLGLDSTKAIQAGDWVRIQSSTYPDPNSNTLGGLRVVQIVGRQPRGDGYQLEWLDGGPATAPLVAPVIASIVLDATDPYSRALLTCTGVSAKDYLVVESATTPGAAPGPTDPLWQPYGVGGQGAAVFGLSRLPNGAKTWFRAKITRPGRIDSLYSAAVSVTPTAYPAVTGLTAGTPGPDSCAMTWALPAGIQLLLQLYLDVGGGGSPPTTPLIVLAMGSVGYQLARLQPGTTYRFGVRTLDLWNPGYGGAVVFVVFTTASVPAVCPPLRDLQVLFDAGTIVGTL